MRQLIVLVIAACACGVVIGAEDPPTPGGFRLRSEAMAGQVGGPVFPKPYSAPCVERENVFEFTEKPKVKNLGNDKYEITFAVKGNCDVTVGIVDSEGKVVRHLGSGVLGANAPLPFQKHSLKQTIYWNGKDDVDVYHKNPDKLKVRVMLGLKPVFDKRLGGTSPKNLPGPVGGLAIGPDGVYVFVVPGMFAHATIRKFDHDGNYVRSLVPPPADLPESKLGGLGYVEYEPGKRALHGVEIDDSLAHGAWYLPSLNGGLVPTCQPALAGNRLVYANPGAVEMPPKPSKLHYTYTDGSTDVRGMNGLILGGRPAIHLNPRLAVSPDGKTVYMAGGTTAGFGGRARSFVYARSMESDEPARIFAGEFDKPGSDNGHFGDAQGLDCDTEGRVYVADAVNARIQVFSAEGKHLKTIPIDRPNLICVHKKTGAIYVQHQARVQGVSVSRVTKLISFADPREELHFDGMMGMMALDSWSEKPRLWFAGGSIQRDGPEAFNKYQGPASVTIWEERRGTFEKIVDFDDEARKEAGESWVGRWNGDGSRACFQSVCDPTREKLYYCNACIFDLASGKYEGSLRLPGCTDDIAFDKRGYLHGHFNPCFFMQGVGRFDPARGADFKDWGGKVHKNTPVYPECPYDYGEEKGGLLGVLPVKDQPGACGFQMGLGVTMRGEVAENCNIYYVPKMDDEAKAFAMQGSSATTAAGHYNEEDISYANFLKNLKEAEKRGEQTYSIRRVPGIPLMGGTVWTFERNGELRKECAVNAGKLINGVQVDEDMSVYFVSARTRVYSDRPFLYGRGGHFGVPTSRHLPFTGTLIKTKPDAPCRVLLKNAPVPMEPPPNRPPELASISFADDDADNKGLLCWIEGAEWLYAGASPIVDVGCVCPAQRFHLDWYKRTYVPEIYRHSIGILDTNGNLIMHVGRYANFDSAPGGKDGCKPGDTDIGMTAVRYIGGTDNYLAFEDWGERLVVMKLNYHAEESAGISNQ